MNAEREIISIQKCNRKILNGYWVTFIISLITVIFNLALTNHEANEYIRNYIITPSVIIIGIITASELVNKFSNKDAITSNTVIITGVLVSFILIYSHSDVENILALLFLPQLIATFYFNKNTILFCSILSIISFLVLYLSNDYLNSNLGLTDVVTMMAILFAGTVTIMGFMSNAIHILQNLKITTEAKQDLLVKNIIMDKLYKMDAVTDLYNHITFHEYLEELIKQGEVNDLSLQLAMIDIDNFKRINDIYGHRVGDTILKRVARIIKESVTNNDFVARYGGEEFAIIFTDKTLKEAYNIVENLRIKISETIHEELDHKPTTISIGLHNYIRGARKEELFKLADDSLYEAKRTGKSKTVISQSID